MNIKNALRNSQSGEIILFVVFIVLFMVMFVGLFVSKLLVWQTKIAINTANAVQSYYIADSATESVIYRLSNDDSIPLNPGDFQVGSGMFSSSTSSCKATIIDDNPLTIEIVGMYKGVSSRAIELAW